jgi:hypothetical protein
VATIASLDVEVGARTGGLTTGLQQGAQSVVAFSQRVEAALRQVPAELISKEFFTGLLQGAAEAAQEIVSLGATADAATGSAAALARAVGATGDAAQRSAEQMSALAVATEQTRRAPIALLPAQSGNIAATAEQIAVLSGALQQVPAAAGASATATGQMATAFDVAGAEAAVLSRETRDVVAGADAMARGVSGAAAQARIGGASFEFHGTAARKATNALTALAATSLQVEGPVARLAESALLFGGGEVAVVGVAGAVLGLAAAYNFATTAEREHDEVNKRIVQGLLQEADQAIPSAIHALEALTAAREAEAKARQGIGARARSGVLDVLSVVANPTGLGQAVGGEVIRRDAQARTDATRAEQQAQEDLNKSVTDFEALNAKSLTESIQLHTASADQIRTAQQLAAILTHESEQGNRPIAERNELLRLALGIQDALNTAAQKEADLRERIRQQAESAQAANITNLAAAPGLGTDTQVSQIERAVELQRLTAIIKDQTLPLEERNTAAQQFNQLVAGAEAPLERQRQEALAIADAWRDVQHTVAELTDAAVAAVQKSTAALAPSQFDELLRRQRQQVVDSASADASTFTVDDSVSAGFERAQGSVRDLNDALVDAIRSSDKFGARAVRNAADTRTANERAADSVHAITRGLDSVAAGAASLGLIGNEALNSIGSVLDLADALANVAANASAGNIIGAIGAGLGFIGAITAQTESQRNLATAMQSNEEAVRENTRAQLKPQTAQDVAEERSATANIVTNADSLRTQDFLARTNQGPKAFEAQFTEDLKKQGVSLVEFEAAAKQAGFTLRDASGQLRADLVIQFAQAVQDGTVVLTGLGDAAQTATDRLLNIPEGFKIEAARFAAQDSVSPVSLPPGSSIDTRPTAPPPVTVGASSVAVTPPSVTAGQSPGISVGQIVFNVDARGKDVRKFVDEFLDELSRRGMATTGRTIDWSEVNP